MPLNIENQNTLAPRPVVTSQVAQDHVLGARSLLDETLKNMDTQRQLKNQIAHQNFQYNEQKRVADEQNQLKLTLQNVKKML